MNLGYFAYRQYYPSLADSLSHDAYKARLSPFEQDIPQSEVGEQGEEEALLDDFSEESEEGPVASGSRQPR